MREAQVHREKENVPLQSTRRLLLLSHFATWCCRRFALQSARAGVASSRPQRKASTGQAEERGSGIELPAQRDHIVLIAARAVKKNERSLGGFVRRRLKTMDEAEIKFHFSVSNAATH